MTTIRRLSDSCVLVTTDEHATMFDPGFHTFESGEVDLETIGDVTRIVISHEHADHVSPDFIRWVRDRNSDLAIHCNPKVASILEEADIAADIGVPEGMTAEDVLHEPLPTGAQPPNRAFTLTEAFTHPGDSQGLSESAPVLALPLMAPWTSITRSVAFAKRLSPDQVIPIHDFYLSASGRDFARRLGVLGLDGTGIELVPLRWGDEYTL